jgi:hypothetical protein
MGFFKGLFSTNRNNNIINIFLKDNKCGHKIRVVLRKSYDIQRVYDDQDQEAAFMINKLIICDKCFNKINIDIKFDKRYNILSRKIDNGEFITEEEYNKH